MSEIDGLGGNELDSIYGPRIETSTYARWLVGHLRKMAVSSTQFRNYPMEL
jgi:hypothetical protein